MLKRILVSIAIALLVAVPAMAQPVAQITSEDIEAADAARKSAAAALEDVTRRYDAAITREEQLREDLRLLAIGLAATQADVTTLDAEAQAIVRETYKTFGEQGIAGLFDTARFTDVTVRSSYMSFVSELDAQVLIRLESLQGSLVDQQERLEAAAAVEAELRQEIDDLAGEILGELERAQEQYSGVVAAFEAQEAERRRLEEEARLAAEEAARLEAEQEAARLATTTTTTLTATTTTTPVTSTTVGSATSTTTTVAGDTTTTVAGDTTTTTTTAATTTTTTLPPPPAAGTVCPVDGPSSFVDSWHAARSGGRLHKGVDMIAPRGTPLVAMESGTITQKRTNSLGGLVIWLDGDSGDEYYYAHLDDWAPGIEVGSSVATGQVIGYVGNSGNARYTVTHVHFEIHPGGGAAVNPYPVVKALCG